MFRERYDFASLISSVPITKGDKFERATVPAYDHETCARTPRIMLSLNLTLTVLVLGLHRPFLISGIRPDIRFRLPDIRPEKLYMAYPFFKT